MAHPTRFKVKRNGNWVDVDDLPAVRDQEQSAGQRAPSPVQVDGLPDLDHLDPDVPLEQLFYEHPEVRPYITEDGQVRTGMDADQERQARQILQKYKR